MSLTVQLAFTFLGFGMAGFAVALGALWSSLDALRWQVGRHKRELDELRSRHF